MPNSKILALMEPLKQDVEAELNQILSSPQIGNSTVLSDFLKFVVLETLDGRSEELKEYTIGINVLKRDSDFNPQIDAIVRIHAGRLRRALKEYYYEDGRNDELVISIPKGGYIPSFQVKPEGLGENYSVNDELTDNKAKKTISFQEDSLTFVSYQKERFVNPKISLAVLPFKHIGGEKEGENFTQSMSEYISTELSLFHYLNIISYYSGNAQVYKVKDVREIGALLGTEYMLTGSVQLFDNRVRIWVQLSNREGEQLWGHTFEKKDTDQSLWEYQDFIVKYLIAYVMGINGLILRDQFKRISNTNDRSNPILPLYWYAKFDASYTERFTTQAKKFYHQLIEEEPENALAHAYLSKILIGELLLFPRDKDENIQLSYTHSQLALKLDPLCQQAYIAIAATYFLKHEKERCIDILEQGLKVNPRNFDYQNSMGAILFSMGEFERGEKLLYENFLLNPNNILMWQKMYFTYYLYQQKKYEETITLLDQINLEGVCAPILKASSYAQINRLHEGQKVIDQLKNDIPKINLSTGYKELKKYFYSEEFVNALLEGLTKLKL